MKQFLSLHDSINVTVGALHCERRLICAGFALYPFDERDDADTPNSEVTGSHSPFLWRAGDPIRAVRDGDGM